MSISRLEERRVPKKLRTSAAWGILRQGTSDFDCIAPIPVYLLSKLHIHDDHLFDYSGE